MQSYYNNKVYINRRQCESCGNALKPLKIRDEFYRRPFLKNEHAVETQLSMLFNAVAICHQTRLFANPEHNLYGWDYLEWGFLNLANASSWLLQPAKLLTYSVNDIAQALTSAFSPNNDGINSTLDTATERAALMHALAGFVLEKYGGSFATLLASAQHQTGGVNGIYTTLNQTVAFEDPRKKKTSFLVKLLHDAGLFIISDPQHYVPIMDYHMQRVLLRTGCVEIKDPDLFRMLANQEPQDTDEPVRSACIDALTIIADISGHPVWVMNDFLWPLGRSCCNTHPLCVSGRCEKEPCTFALLAALPGNHKKCIFQEFCIGSHDDNYRNLYEPIIKTHYY
ncbi:MAG: hypothetical protein PHX54_00250 [Lentimicrobiaceae bacterium]|nr:hypothetical protein [Lentimicrobiaceae bacterium]